jgi:hypothetical protein
LALPLALPQRQPLAVAPAVAAAAALAVGATLYWVQIQLSRKNLKREFWQNQDVNLDGVYRRPDYRAMTQAELQTGLRLLDTVGRDSYVAQPSGVLIERRGIQQEFQRRSGGGGFLFVPPAGFVNAEAQSLTAGAAALALGSGLALWDGAVWVGGALGNGLKKLSQLWGLINAARTKKPALSWSEVTTEPIEFPAPGTVRTQTGGYVNTTTYYCGSVSYPPFVTNTTGSYVAETVSNCSAVRLRQVLPTDSNGVLCGNYPDNGRVCEAVPEYLVNGQWVKGPNGGWGWGPGANDSFYRFRVEGTVKARFLSVSYNGSPAQLPQISSTLQPHPALAFAPAAAPKAVEPVAEPAVVGASAVQPVPGATAVATGSAAGGSTGTGTAAPAGVQVGGAQGVPQLPRPVLIPGGATTTEPQTGTVTQPLPEPAPVTDPGAIVPWPGAKPVGLPGQAPPATLEGIASEVGKIEKKLEQAFTNPKPADGLNWEEWWDAAGKLYNLLTSLLDEGEWTLSSPCVPEDEPGGRKRPLVRGWDGSLTPGAGLQKRLDALAGMIQDHKDLKQPICTTHEPKQGIAHRVRFISDGVSPRNGKHYLRELGYRDQSGRALAEHREHWKTFRWESGPYQVISRGLPWGQPQVWASSFEEGRRVLAHAAAIAGVDVSVASHRWIERVSTYTRNGAVESFGVARDRTGEAWVVTREEPSGWPELSPEFRTDP